MAKKDKKKAKKDATDDPVAALRSYIERTFSASAEGAQATRDRTREIVDEITAAASRVRHTLEDMRVLDEVKRLRGEVESLAARVASLERPRGGGATQPKPAAASAGMKPSAKRAARASKPRARAAAGPKATAPAAATVTKTPAAPRKTAPRKRAAMKKPPAAETPTAPAAETPMAPAAEIPKPAPSSGTS